MNQEEVSDSVQARHGLEIVNGDRLLREVATGHDQGLKTAGSQEQMMQRRVRQENTVLEVERRATQRSAILGDDRASFLRSSTMGRSGLEQEGARASSSSQ